MKIMPLKINSIRSLMERCTGFYSKKGCIETATDIGKSIADIRKSGKNITKQDVERIISEKAPHLRKPNIATNKDEFIFFMRNNSGRIKHSLSQAIKLNVENENIAGAFSQDLKGIFVKLDYPQQRIIPGVFAHELEHFMEYYANPQTILKRFFSYTKNLFKIFNKNKIESPVNNRRNLFLEQKKAQQKPLRMQIYEDLMYRFGVLGAAKPNVFEKGVVEGYSSTSKGFEQFLQSENYTGLTNPKRIDAYIRTILRHYVHPMVTKPKVFAQIKERMAGEARAYQVSDNILRYNTGKEGLSYEKMRSEIFKRATQILDDEINIARFHGNRKMPKHRTGLPSSAVIETKI